MSQGALEKKPQWTQIVWHSGNGRSDVQQIHLSWWYADIGQLIPRMLRQTTHRDLTGKDWIHTSIRSAMLTCSISGALWPET